VCPTWGELTWYSWMLEWRSMTHTTVTCFWLKSYCLQCVRSVPSFFIFQQCNAPAAVSPACETLSLLERQTPAFVSLYLWPLNITDLNPLDCEIWRKCSSRSTELITSMNWSSAWSVWHRCEQSVISDVSQLMSGANVSLSLSLYLCVCVWSCERRKFLSFNLTSYNAYGVLHIIFVFLWIFNRIYRVTCCRISPVLVFCILQGSE